MIKPFNSTLKLLLAFLPLFSCVDNNYDLSDIDTTVEVKINDLVIPINIDEIKLSTILDLDSGSRIQERDGSYVIIENGDINSEQIKVAAISVEAPAITPISRVIDLTSNASGVDAAPGSVTVGPLMTSFEYSYNNVDACITDIKNVGTENFIINISLNIKDNNNSSNDYYLNQLTLQLPDGLEGTASGGSYDKATGTVTFNSVTMTNGSFNFDFNVSKINIVEPTSTFSPDNHTFQFSSEIGITSIEIDTESILNSVNPSSMLTLTIDIEMSPLNITSFSGRINYDLSGFNIESISLDNLPGLLTQEETNIGICNPQIYLSLNNPLDIYGLYATANIAITPYRDGVAGTVARPDNGVFQIGKGGFTGDIYNYCLSPEGPSQSMLYEYPLPNEIKFSSLSNILFGNGLPSSISIEIENPSVPNLEVTNLLLGVDLGAVSGKYSFYAPLAFTENSQIIYTGTTDGWDSEDIENLTINTLEVSLTVKNNLPISLALSGTPINKEGQPINSVKLEGATIQGGSTSDITIRATGSIVGLDGIEYHAVGTIANPGIAISPDQSIELSNIRAKVSGSYIKTL